MPYRPLLTVGILCAFGCGDTSVLVLSGAPEGGAAQVCHVPGAPAGLGDGGGSRDAAPAIDAAGAGLADAQATDVQEAAAPRGPHGGTWPTYAHDSQRTSRAQGAGAITVPEVAWTMHMGGALFQSQGLVGDVDGDGRPNAVTIIGGQVTATNPDGSTLWRASLAGPSAILGIWNLDGAGAPEVVVQASIGVTILAGLDGHALVTLPATTRAEAVFIQEGATGGGILAVAQSLATMQAYDFRNGIGAVSAPLWTAPTEDPADMLVGDIDGDGASDLVLALNAGFEVFDPLTGQAKYKADPIGPAAFFYVFQLANVDGNPGAEIVAVDTSYKYSPSAGIYVLGVRNGALAPLWSSTVAAQVALDVDFYTIAGAVVDIFGDGMKELVYSQWDGVPQTWTTRIVDAATGTPITSLSGELIQAIADVDGDGKPDLAVRSSPLANQTPARSELRAYGFSARAAPPVAKPWMLPSAHVVVLPPSVHPSGGQPDQPVVADFDPAPGSELLVGQDTDNRGADGILAVVRGDGSLASTFAVAQEITPSVLWAGDAWTSASSQSDILEYGTDGIARDLTAQLQQKGSFSSGSYANWVGVYGLDAQRTVLAMATSYQDLLWLDGSHVHLDGTPYQLNHVPGVLDTSPLAENGYPFDPMTYLVGPSPTLVAYQQSETTMTMVGFDISGVESWRTPLAPGAQVSTPGPYAIDLNGSGTDDLVAPVTNINSLESIAVFDSQTGVIAQSTPIASIVSGLDELGTGCLVDINGDGIADLVTPGHAGGDLAIDLTKNPMQAFWDIPYNPSIPRINGTIAGATVDATGTSLLRFNGNNGFAQYARYSLDGGVVVSMDEGIPAAHGLDTNGVALVERSPGSGDFDMVAAGTADVALSRVRRIAGDTLATVWTQYVANGVSSPLPPSQAFALHDPITMDVDGDGTEEVVLGSDDGYLYALHAADGSVEFSIDLGAPIEHVIAADIDLDPELEIIVSLADGRLLAIDGLGQYHALSDSLPSGDAGPDAAQSSDAGTIANGGPSDAAGATEAGPVGSAVVCEPIESPTYVPVHASCAASDVRGAPSTVPPWLIAAGFASVVARRRASRRVERVRATPHRG
jgi:hypothetical protein